MFSDPGSGIRGQDRDFDAMEAGCLIRLTARSRPRLGCRHMLLHAEGTDPPSTHIGDWKEVPNETEREHYYL
jgi:hypothetical protein